MVLGLITGATIEVSAAWRKRCLARSEANFAILGPMYSISTDSISMKTNCSDFEDGAEVNDRPGPSYYQQAAKDTWK